MREIASPLSGPFTTFGQTPIDIYKVGAYRPELAYSFYNEYYRRGRQPVNFLDAITHTRNGNATMAGDYGPEKITDTSWTLGSGWSLDGDVLVASGTTYNADYSLVSEGKTYEVTFRITDYVSGGVRFRFTGSTNNNGTIRDSNGVFTQVIDTTNGNTVFRFDDSGSGFTGRIDNISVREVPKIQWAPHNLLKYSEDLASGGGAYGTGVISGNEFTFTVSGDYFRMGSTMSVPSKGKYTGKVTISGGEMGDTFALELVDDADGSDSNTTIVTLDGTTTEWTVEADFSGSSTFSGSLGFYINRSSASRSVTAGSTITVNYMHVYRSDLGGMADNPDQPASLASYVPTTSSAVYLPRRGHHVYNGSQWVNKGLLHESEARTNLVTYSEDLSNAAWIKATNLTLGTPLSIGGISLDLLQNNGVANFRDVTQNGPSVPAGGYVTFSVYVKAGTSSETAIRIQDPTNTDKWTVPITWASGIPSFQGGTGTLGWTETQKTIENVGAGVYRVALTIKNDTAGAYTATCKYYVQWDDAAATVDTYAGGFQAELGSTPSSYIPTNGATVTRPAESITIPAANLPWPNPVYVTGEELVTNGTFDTDTSGWTADQGGTIAYSLGTVQLVAGATTLCAIVQPETFSTTKVYELTFDVSEVSTTGIKLYNYSGDLLRPLDTDASVGTYKDVFVGGTTRGIDIRVNAANGEYVKLDNISVKEINPLALSIQMQGEMTIADEDYIYEAEMVRWQLDANNYVKYRARTTADVNSFRLDSLQAVGGTVTPINMQTPYADVNINVPFNIASRHGSTFVNGAVDGTALTANTTPVALPDLENTDLELGYDFMGTISLFRFWANDLGDTGIEEATEPSTEATLFLSFDGTENSYVNFDWSE